MNRNLSNLHLMLKMAPVFEMLCISNILKTKDNVQHNICITNKTLPQTLTTVVVNRKSGKSNISLNNPWLICCEIKRKINLQTFHTFCSYTWTMALIKTISSANYKRGRHTFKIWAWVRGEIFLLNQVWGKSFRTACCMSGPATCGCTVFDTVLWHESQWAWQTGRQLF
jgi:hypothetical protein